MQFPELRVQTSKVAGRFEQESSSFLTREFREFHFETFALSHEKHHFCQESEQLDHRIAVAAQNIGANKSNRDHARQWDRLNVNANEPTNQSGLLAKPSRPKHFSFHPIMHILFEQENKLLLAVVHNLMVPSFIRREQSKRIHLRVSRMQGKKFSQCPTRRSRMEG